MTKYWYFTALVTIQPQHLNSLSQDYYVSAVAENNNSESLFTLGVADIQITDVLEKNQCIKNLLDIASRNFICVIEVPKYEFDNQKVCVIKK